MNVNEGEGNKTAAGDGRELSSAALAGTDLWTHARTGMSWTSTAAALRVHPVYCERRAKLVR